MSPVLAPVRQRVLLQFQLQPGPMLRAQPLPRHRALRSERPSPAVAPGPELPPHRPFGDPQVVRDLLDRVTAGEPPGGPGPLLPGRPLPAPLRIPHIRSYARSSGAHRPDMGSHGKRKLRVRHRAGRQGRRAVIRESSRCRRSAVLIVSQSGDQPNRIFIKRAALGRVIRFCRDVSTERCRCSRTG